ncbi:MAG: nitroreductase family protein [Nitrospiraceae bacterium]|nr:nitroreductase family protein [Nitrospiraceae bacterium]
MLEAIKRRRSYRQFLKRDIEEDKLKEVLKAALFAPTAKNLRPCEFVVVKNEEMRARLSKATPYSAFARNAPAVIVICYDPSRGRRFREDCSLGAGSIYLEAVNQGLGTCFVQVADAELGPELKGLFEGNPEEYIKKELGIPAGFRIQCMMPIGYPEGKELPPHSDEEFDAEKIHYEKF